MRRPVNAAVRSSALCSSVEVATTSARTSEAESTSISLECLTRGRSTRLIGLAGSL